MFSKNFRSNTIEIQEAVENKREQKKNEETFSIEAPPKFLMEKCVLKTYVSTI